MTRLDEMEQICTLLQPKYLCIYYTLNLNLKILNAILELRPKNNHKLTLNIPFPSTALHEPLGAKLKFA